MSIEDKIRGYLGEYVLFSDNGLEYGNDDSFLESGIVDSVAVMELTLFVEEMFGIFVEDQDITPDNFDSVNKLAQFIRSRLNSKE
jgi:acyl carrier protein